MKLKNRIANKLLKSQLISRILVESKIIFLTFDDGPEPYISEFVLNELDKYGFKATFFCRGDNAEKYPELLQRIKLSGHTIGNHTYNHLHAFNCPSIMYINDVNNADRILHTELFRPPYGCLTVNTWMNLKDKYRMYYWSLNSGDSDAEKFNYKKSLTTLKNDTKPGDIVLFHSCIRHEGATRCLLPDYLIWLIDNGYRSCAIKFK